ncbi:MAG: hypothetical protein ACLFVS_04230 [Candidatus Acetothermia bacterium]
MLTLRGSRSREEIIRDYENTFNYDESAISTAVQPMSGFDFEGHLDSLLDELEADGLVRIDGNKIFLPSRGKGYPIGGPVGQDMVFLFKVKILTSKLT